MGAEFPEIFERGGFNAFVGNPPFRGGKLLSGILGKEYREYLVERLAGNTKGHADLCAYFFLRAVQLLRFGGIFGLLATNSIAEGDTREVALDRFGDLSCVLVRAVKSSKWPGVANLEVAQIWGFLGSWNGSLFLNDEQVSGITAFLEEARATSGKPYRLGCNKGRGFAGTYVLGTGFVVQPAEAKSLIEADTRNSEVIQPYLNGEDLNSRPDQSPSRRIINFRDWPLERAREFPLCMRIVEQRVKDERMKLGLKNDASAKVYARLWWQFGRRSSDLYSAIAGQEKTLVACRHTKYVTHSLVSAQQIFDVALNVIPYDESYPIGILHSSIFDAWASRVRIVLGDANSLHGHRLSGDIPVPS